MLTLHSRKKRNRFKYEKWIGLLLLFLAVLVGMFIYNDYFKQTENDMNSLTDANSPEEIEVKSVNYFGNESINSNQSIAWASDESMDEETFIDIRISAAGDVMGHLTQVNSAYVPETDTYDFTSVFEDVAPYISEADLAIVNLETTLAGSRLPFSGYPMFNTPDSIIDALAFAGFDTIVTANNHSLDTGPEGLKRTVEVIKEKGLDPAGTYASEPDSRVLIKDVEGIKVAILAYTEHLNGVDAGYPSEQVNAMVDIISEERIISDIEEAKASEADLIISFMHWGAEYQREPNEFQTTTAELLTREGVDIIFGSHPHMIQKASYLEVDGNESIVVYSLGNFISNQRRETLGEGMEPTEDGVIFNIDVQKNEQTGETTIKNVDFTSTWVYRHTYEGDRYHTYRIMPVESAIKSGELSETYQNRMRRSLEETTIRLNLSESDEN